MRKAVDEASSDWTIKPLSELADAIQYGYTAKAKAEKNGIRYLRITDIQDDKVNWSSVPSCDVPESEWEKYLLSEGDLVFARTGATVGKSYLVRGRVPKAVFASYLIRVRLKAGLDPRYVAHFFQSPSYWQQIAESSAGIGQPNVNGTKLAQIRVPVAPSDQQIKIVAEIEKQFSRLDEAVANLQRVKANLKRYKAAILKAAVEGRLVETEASIARREGRSYETGEQLLQRVLEERQTGWDGKGAFKPSTKPEVEALPAVAEGWAWASVDQLAAPGSRSITDGPFGSNLKSMHYVESGPRVIRLQNIKDGEFEDAYAHITPEHFESLRKHEVFAGDLVIASLGENPPRSCIIPSGVGRAIVKADCIRFKPHAVISPRYVNAALNCQPTRMRVKEVLHGIGRPRLSLGEIRAIALPIPPEAEQVRIAAEVDRQLSIIREVEAEVDANLKRAQALRHSILQRAFSTRSLASSSDSEADERKPNLEPASVVIAARVISQMGDVPSFGRVKLQKLLFLSTHHARVGAINDQYVRMQAGPLDMQMLTGVLERLDQLRWFRECQRSQNHQSNSNGYVYERLSCADDYRKHLAVVTAEQLTLIDHVCDSLRSWPTEDCELLATVYAAWNDLLLWRHPVSEDAIFEQLHEHWHESKRRFSEQQIAAMKHRITELGLEPTGFGKPTLGAAADVHSGDLFGK